MVSVLGVNYFNLHLHENTLFDVNHTAEYGSF